MSKKIIIVLTLTLLLGLSCGVPQSYRGKCRVCVKNFDQDVTCGIFMPFVTATTVAERKKNAWVECY